MAKKAVIYLRKNHLAILVDGDPNQGFESDWDGVKLEEILEKVKDELKVKHAYVLLGGDASYCLSLPLKGKPDRETLLKEAQAHVPEDLDDHNFDWKKMGERIQIVATSPFRLQALADGAKKADLDLELVLPSAIVLASLPETKTVSLVIWQGIENLAVLCQDGVVYLVQSVEQITPESVAELIAYAKDKFKLTVSAVVSNAAPVAVPEGVTWQKHDLPLYATTLDYKETRGDDAMELSLNLPQAEIKPVTPTTVSENPTVAPTSPAAPVVVAPGKRSPLPIILAGIAAGLVAILGLGFFRAYQGGSVSLTPTPTPTTTPTPPPSPTPPPEPNYGDFSVRVENGSGVPGTAGAVADLLRPAGFEIAGTGNAANYAYTQTIVRTKEGVSPAVFDKIASLLTDYVLETGETLANAAEYDVLVIVGEKK